MNIFIKYIIWLLNVSVILLQWFVWDFMGFHALWVKLFPPPNRVTSAPDYKPPTTIGIWLIGFCFTCLSIYFACLGFATARYERLLDRAEFRYNTLTTQLAAKVTFDSRRVKEVGKFEVPVEPKVEFNTSNPIALIKPIWNSLHHDKPYYSTHKKNTKDENGNKGNKQELVSGDEFLLLMVELWKSSLNGANLERANLKGANLIAANLENANLVGANLEEADLRGANLIAASLQGASLRGAYLSKANLMGAYLIAASFEGANLRNANLMGAHLWIADLEGAFLGGTNLEEADLEGADLRGANLIAANLEGADLEGADLKGANFGSSNEETIEILSEVRTLFEATGLPPEIKKGLMKRKPELLEEPIRR